MTSAGAEDKHCALPYHAFLLERARDRLLLVGDAGLLSRLAGVDGGNHRLLPFAPCRSCRLGCAFAFLPHCAFHHCRELRLVIVIEELLAAVFIISPGLSRYV